MDFFNLVIITLFDAEGNIMGSFTERFEKPGPQNSEFMEWLKYKTSFIDCTYVHTSEYDKFCKFYQNNFFKVVPSFTIISV